MGHFVDDRDATQAMLLEAFSNQITAVEEFGRGTLEIGDYGLKEGEGGCPIIQWLTFSVQIEGGYDH